MGASCSNKPLTQTVTLTQPLTRPTEEVAEVRLGKQTVQANIQSSNASPLSLNSLHTWSWENAVHHHTKDYSLPRSGTLVVRRGQPFKVTLTFNRPYNSLIDELKFFFETGDTPLPGNDTMVCLSSYTSQGSSGWKCDFLPVLGMRGGGHTDRQVAHLWVFPPCDCIVADWRFSVQSILRTERDTATVSYEHPDRIYILFNPWCKADAVYYPAQPLLEEYILNSSGIMFTGCSKLITVKPWVFGQFEPGVLEACVYLVKRAAKFRSGPALGDPVTVVRNIAATVSIMVNAENNDGILQGRWSTSDFTGGRPPTTWSGSVAILKQYVESALATKGDNPEPVKYGHCCVYAGLVTTICRAIGIPCRCVTNYNSGRGSDGNINIDLYYELLEDGSIAEENRGDCGLVWSFHVWNDVWMRRSDLYQPYNEPEWQAIDATPHPAAVKGNQCCGPASLAAIKNGLLDMNYNVKTLFAEVNSTVTHWLKLGDGDWTVLQVEDSRVGRCISTKIPDGHPVRLVHTLDATQLARIRQDVTSEYKYKQGTKSLAAVMEHVKIKSRNLPKYRCNAKDVGFIMDDKEYERIGDDFFVRASVSNNGDEAREVKVMLLLETIHYNDRRHLVVKQQSFEVTVEPGQSEHVQMVIYEEDYVGKLTEHVCLRQVGFLRVAGTGQVDARTGNFVLQRPHLDMHVCEDVFKGRNFEMKMSFKNPLHRKLTQCTVSVEGAGLEAMLYITNIQKVAAQSVWTGILNLVPVRSKRLELSATFHCKQLLDIVGSLVVKVEKGEPPPQVGSAHSPGVLEHQKSATSRD